MNNYRNVDENCLIIRNLPPSFTDQEIRQFLEMFDPVQVQIFDTHHTCFAEFANKDHAKEILSLLHQIVLDGFRLFVEFAPKNRNEYIALCSQTFYAPVTANTQAEKESSECSKCVDKEKNDDISEAVKRLYGIADNLNLNQPPPPYLNYEYPLANRDIIDAISIALETIPKFYIQVLHLMNRMNLEPPFVPGDKHLAYASVLDARKLEPTVPVATQTDEIMWQNLVRNKRKFIESDESELETSADSSASNDEDGHHLKVKRKKNHQDTIDNNKTELLKQKQRNLLRMQRLQKEHQMVANESTKPQTICEVFEMDARKAQKMANIKIIVPDQLEVKSEEQSNLQISVEVADTTSNQHIENKTQNFEPSICKTISNAEINENRIPSNQLKEHPLYQNYNAGTITNRLYIKNIAKDVTEDDLKAIYSRYLEGNCGGQGNIRSIDIRLMTSGRMKGQAFVTFDGPYLNCDVDDEETMNLPNKYQMIEKARCETNGLIVKTKPLVVVYGKK